MGHSGVRRKKIVSFRNGLVVMALVTLPWLAGCTGLSPQYVERHEIKHMTVVFLDEESLHEEWERITGRHAVRLVPRMTNRSPATEIKTVRGFFDFRTHTLYCPKWDFKACGHELHHAILGQFHVSR